MNFITVRFTENPEKEYLVHKRHWEQPTTLVPLIDEDSEFVAYAHRSQLEVV